jgi:predicted glycosyltransferase
VAFSICLAIVRNLKPEMVVFDCLPSFPFVSAAIECDLPMVLCLRKMKEFDKYLEQMRDILPSLSLILVPHDPGEFTVPAWIEDKTVFVGQVVRPDLSSQAESVDDESRYVVITAGGGGYPGTVDFYNMAVRALSILRKRVFPIEGLLVTGPLFTEWNHLELAEGVKVLPFAPQMTSTLANAALVISQAGYNTVAELGALGTKTIFVPAERAYDDQHERAIEASQLNPHLHAFSGKTDLELAELMERCMRAPKIRTPRQIARGASTAAEHLYALLSRTRAARLSPAAAQ